MAEATPRQETEHILAKRVAEWVAAREEKREVLAEHNAAIKALEDSIERLVDQIRRGGYQPTLPGLTESEEVDEA